MSTRRHPSAKFQNGEITNFYQAMQCLIEQQKEENRIGRELNREAGHVTSGEELREMQVSIDNVRSAVNLATQHYEEIVEEAMKRFTQKLESYHDPLLNDIAIAVKTGDYSGLAI